MIKYKITRVPPARTSTKEFSNLRGERSYTRLIYLRKSRCPDDDDSRTILELHRLEIIVRRGTRAALLINVDGSSGEVSNGSTGTWHCGVLDANAPSCRVVEISSYLIVHGHSPPSPRAYPFILILLHFLLLLFQTTEITQYVCTEEISSFTMFLPNHDIFFMLHLPFFFS